jgi:N-acetylmuramoyl-L-alanine amidase
VNAAYAAGAPPILVDPGHGGEDGGAIGVDGTIEKDVNLQIAMKLNAFLCAFGYHTSMTRTKDVATFTPGTTTLRAKKTSDIHNRFAQMNALGSHALFVSIHQNKFEDAQQHGTQVFYSKNDARSVLLANAIQKRVVAQTQPDNKRLVKPSGTQIYLLYEAKIPAVLVECGFLSNYEETQKLKENGYQNRLALSIAAGILDYASNCAPDEQAPQAVYSPYVLN